MRSYFFDATTQKNLLQFTHSCGVRCHGADLQNKVRGLQFTHSCGVRCLLTAIGKKWCVLQFTHSCGVRFNNVNCVYQPNDYNSRTHAECDTLRNRLLCTAWYYNSRTHAECDSIDKNIDLSFRIPYRSANSHCEFIEIMDLLLFFHVYLWFALSIVEILSVFVVLFCLFYLYLCLYL